jgi:hypothetical protein
MERNLSITFDGYHCLAVDKAGQLAEHINRHFSHFFEPAGNYDSSEVAISQISCRSRQPLILPQWNPQPRLGLYQFYDPSGYSRVGKMFVLMQESDARFLGNKYHPVKLVKNGEALTVRPMRISRTIAIASNLVLLELQDIRALARTVLFNPNIAQPASLTLNEFISFCVIDLNSQLQDDYLTASDFSSLQVNVDLQNLWRRNTPIVHLLDAAIGAARYPGRQDYLDFATHYVTALPNHLLATYRNVIPSSLNNVSVNFPRLLNNRLRDDLSNHIIKSSSNALPKEAHVTCSAPAVVAFASQSTPSNITELADLAHRVQAAESHNTTSVVKQQVPLLKDLFKTQYAPCDSLIIDLNHNGPGVLQTIVPSMNFPLQRHYYWIKDTKPTCEPMDVIRVQLLENLPVCSDAAAVHLSNLEDTESCPCGFVRQVLVRDTAGIARTRIQNNQRFAPVQSMGFARHLACADTGEMDVYELISIGQGCCPPPDSSDVPNCCQQWFTRYENLGTVTDKSVGAVIATGEVIGSLKVTGGDYWLDYKAYLSNSDSSDGCGIDLSGIHEFSQEKTSRTSGTSPCSPSATQCAIDFALLQMSGRLPVEKAACNIWYEDLGAAGNGNDYHRRRLKSTLPGCAAGKKVYNVSSVFTTVLTKGADYVVLKHWCADASSSSSSGTDECCAQFTDYDLRCVDGVLQRWIRQYEVCWNGDCLDTRVLQYWQPTGETVGCCDCGSGNSASSSSGAPEPPDCVDGVTVSIPGTGYQSGGPFWDIISASYDMATGNWSITATANANAGVAPSCGAYYICDVNANAASNPAVTNCSLGNSTVTNGPFCQGQTVTITGTSTPPTSANCSNWFVSLKTGAIPFLTAGFDCEPCDSVAPL